MAGLEALKPIPTPSREVGQRALAAILEHRSVLAGLRVFHELLGDVFRFSVGAFRPVVMVGPDAARFMLVSARHDLHWRPEGDPVARLLRHGLLVTDGEAHDDLRRRMAPALHKKRLGSYVESMWRLTDRVAGEWLAERPVDMLVEMRRVALLIVMRTLFEVDFQPDLERLFPAILRILRYISPGLWTIWPGIPRLGYRRAMEMVDEYIYGVIAARRKGGEGGEDLLGLLMRQEGMRDDLVRDQVLTLLIAGHDTSTAALAWALYLLGSQPEVMRDVRREVDQVLGKLPPTLEKLPELTYLEQVIRETLRLYPPIHIGNRVAARELSFEGFRIPAGTRLVYSIYLTHRHKGYWRHPERFDPGRFDLKVHPQPEPYTYLPFGGGPRNCIGAAFAQLEVKVVLSRLIQRFDFILNEKHVRPRMGATLEPHPGVRMVVRPRT
jgi:cytochrome P450